MNSDKRYILVTGGAGYIGSHTVVALLERDFIPVIVDDFRNAQKDVIQRLEQLSGQEILVHDFACQDKEKMRQVFQHYPIYGVIHFAADKAVGESVANPLKYFDNNLGSLVSLLEVMQEEKVNHLVFSSSCTVYGDPDVIPVTEQSPVSYNSPYGYTKKVSEEIIQQYTESFPQFKATLLRYFNPIGAHESGLIGEEPGGIPNNLLPFITQTAFGIRKELTVFGDDYDTSDGTCVRDYIHVVDLAEAHVAAVVQIAAIDRNPMVYNLGTGKGTTVLQMLHSFKEATGIDLPYVIGPRRAGDVPEIFANTEKANKLLKWTAKRTVKDAVASAWKFEQFIREKRKDQC